MFKINEAKNINKQKKVTIFGAGEVTKYLLTYLASKNIPSEYDLEVNVYNRTPKYAQCLIKDIESLQYLKKSFEGSFYTNNKKFNVIENISEVKNSDIIIIAIGAYIDPEQMNKKAMENNIREFMSVLNYPLIESLAENIKQFTPDSFVITITNQVDFVTRTLQRLLKKDFRRIIGFGGALDSNRFRVCLKKEIENYMPVRDITGYIAGYHNFDMIALSNSITVNNKSIFEIDELRKYEDPFVIINNALIQAKKYGFELIKLNRNNSASSLAAGSIWAESLLAFCFADEPTIIEPCGVYIEKDTDAYELYGINDFLSIPVSMTAQGYSILTDISVTEEEKLQLKQAHINYLCTEEKVYDLIKKIDPTRR